MRFLDVTLGMAAACGVIIGLAATAAAQGPTLPAVANRNIALWFGPLTWDISPITNRIEYTEYDFPALIAPDAPWQTAKSRIATIDLPANVVWSYPVLSNLVAFVNRNPGIAVDFGAGVLYNGGLCGVGVEGISSDPDYLHETVNIAQMWYNAGGRLDYLVMDAPLYYGHAWVGGCNYSIQEVATRAASTINRVRQYFPAVKIVDAEGPAFESNAAWFNDMAEFFTDFKAATGQSIYAVALDLHWQDLRSNETLPDTVRSSVSFFHGMGVRVGLFVDAGGTTAAALMAQDRLELRLLAKAQYGLDFIAMEQWFGGVNGNLPETQLSAYASVINYAYRLFKD